MTLIQVYDVGCTEVTLATCTQFNYCGLVAANVISWLTPAGNIVNVLSIGTASCYTCNCKVDKHSWWETKDYSNDTNMVILNELLSL